MLRYGRRMGFLCTAAWRVLALLWPVDDRAAWRDQALMAAALLLAVATPPSLFVHVVATGHSLPGDQAALPFYVDAVTTALAAG